MVHSNGIWMVLSPINEEGSTPHGEDKMVDKKLEVNRGHGRGGIKRMFFLDTLVFTHCAPVRQGYFPA